MSSETGFVELTLEYEPDVAGGPVRGFATEHYPLRVDYFGTNQLAHCGCPVSPERQTRVFRTSADTRQFSVRIHKHAVSAENGIGAQQPFFEAGAYKPINPPLALKSGLAASTSIVLMFYATTYTTLQQSCWTNVGMAVLPIAALLRSNGRGRRFDVMQYRDPDSEASTPQFSPPRKGTLLVIGFNAGGLNSTPQREVKYDTVDDRVLRGIIDRNLGQFFPDHKSNRTSPLSHPSEPYLRPFHVPVNQQRKRLASCTYALLRAYGAMSVLYYENLLTIALRRSAADVETAMKWSAFIDNTDRPLDPNSSPEQNAIVSIAVRLIVVFPLSQRYLDDTLNRNVQSRPYSAKKVLPDEDFKICRLCGGDDCEGVCLEAMIHMRDLVDADESVRAQMKVVHSSNDAWLCDKQEGDDGDARRVVRAGTHVLHAHAILAVLQRSRCEESRLAAADAILPAASHAARSLQRRWQGELLHRNDGRGNCAHRPCGATCTALLYQAHAWLQWPIRAGSGGSRSTRTMRKVDRHSRRVQSGRGAATRDVGAA